MLHKLILFLFIQCGLRSSPTHAICSAFIARYWQVASIGHTTGCINLEGLINGRAVHYQTPRKISKPGQRASKVSEARDRKRGRYCRRHCPAAAFPSETVSASCFLSWYGAVDRSMTRTLPRRKGCSASQWQTTCCFEILGIRRVFRNSVTAQ